MPTFIQQTILHNGELNRLASKRSLPGTLQFRSVSGEDATGVAADDRIHEQILRGVHRDGEEEGRGHLRHDPELLKEVL